MNDTALNLGFGIYRAYCITKSCKTVYAKDINRLNTAVFKVIQHIKPEFRAFMFADPYTENILTAVHVDTQDHIGGFGYILMVFFNFVVYRVHKHKRINTVKRTVLPSRNLRHYLFADFTDKLGWYFNIVEIFYLFGNIPLTHSAWVQRQYFFLHSVGIAVVFTDDRRLIFSVSVTGNIYCHFAELRFYRLFWMPVPVVFRQTAFVIIRGSFAFFIAELCV